MHKKKLIGLLVFCLSFTMLAGCQNDNKTVNQIVGEDVIQDTDSTNETPTYYEGTEIVLSDETILVDGKEASTDNASAVYTGGSIIYYEAGRGETYGEGDSTEEHTKEEAGEITVITITKPGTYLVSGKLSKGQIAIDLGDDAKEKEEAVVNLVLNNADITCEVAPAIIAYQVYECGSDDVGTATKDVDTSNAGFNLIIADGSENTVTGSHVAKIYKEGTTAEDIANDTAKKAHKYDAAIESLMSFNINGGVTSDGKLTVNADNEGIESRLHMTINGGDITVNANDDSLNAGEDNVSVITVNGGILTCDSGSGDGDEGDGIDSNGWIVINDGYIIACANARSQDSGVDSDKGIYINGGTVLASGHMYDEVSKDSKQNFMVLGFNQEITEDDIILITDTEGNAVSAFKAVNNYNIVVYSNPQLAAQSYNLFKTASVTGTLKGSIYTDISDYEDALQLQYTSNSLQGGKGLGNGKMDGELPADIKKPEGERPEMMEKPIGEPPQDMTKPEDKPEGKNPKQDVESLQPSTVFSLIGSGNQFGGISLVES